LLPIVDFHFPRDGLPENHGVEMYVPRDGQRWYAMRRAVTSWWFAIGAAGPPPDQWLYDGPHPPRGFPAEPEWDRFGEIQPRSTGIDSTSVPTRCPKAAIPVSCG
jgi:hypothetical protein